MKPWVYAPVYFMAFGSLCAYSGQDASRHCDSHHSQGRHLGWEGSILQEGLSTPEEGLTGRRKVSGVSDAFSASTAGMASGHARLPCRYTLQLLPALPYIINTTTGGTNVQ